MATKKIHFLFYQANPNMIQPPTSDSLLDHSWPAQGFGFSHTKSYQFTLESLFSLHLNINAWAGRCWEVKNLVHFPKVITHIFNKNIHKRKKETFRFFSS